MTPVSGLLWRIANRMPPEPRKPIKPKLGRGKGQKAVVMTDDEIRELRTAYEAKHEGEDERRRWLQLLDWHCYKGRCREYIYSVARGILRSSVRD